MRPLARLFFLVASTALMNVPTAALTSAQSAPSPALVLFSPTTIADFQAAINLVNRNGGEVTLAYPPSAFIARLSPAADAILRQRSRAQSVEHGFVDPSAVLSLGPAAQAAVAVWNETYAQPTRARVSLSGPTGPDGISPPIPVTGPDVLRPPDQNPPARMSVGVGPGPDQTSEFMAGLVAVNVIFVQSGASAGFCSPADLSSEQWTLDRQMKVLGDIGSGLAWWSARSGRPDPVTFELSSTSTLMTSCEPASRSSGDEGLWIADVLRDGGDPSADPSNYFARVRAYADMQRARLQTDWTFVIFVVDALHHHSRFADGRTAYAYLNGPFMVMTTQGWQWVPRITAHELGHIFGAYDEYPESGCSPADSWGYLGVPNTSCNNGGDTSDVSLMGSFDEMTADNADLSVSARGAIGWRNPSGGEMGKTVVDVVRTATATLMPYSPDPTNVRNPALSAVAGNVPFPPGLAAWPSHRPVTVSTVAGAEWALVKPPPYFYPGWTTEGVRANDGSFDEPSETYTFTSTLPVPIGGQDFDTVSINNFGHRSTISWTHLTVLDTLAPSTVASVSPLPNPAGWNNTSPMVAFNAKDDLGGSGVMSLRIQQSTDGIVQPELVVSGASASIVVSLEGHTVLTYSATDAAGNAERPRAVLVNLDRTPPVINMPTQAIFQNATSPIGILVAGVPNALFPVTVTDNLDPAPSLSCGNIHYFSIGTNWPLCRATDAADNVSGAEGIRRDPDYRPGPGAIVVFGPIEQLKQLQSITTVYSSPLPSSDAAVLRGDVQQALAAASTGERQNACGWLASFTADVQAEPSLLLTPTQRANLVRLAGNIRNVLGCSMY